MPFEFTRPLDDLKLEAIARINAKAGEIISNRVPLWKQANLSTRAVELQSIGMASWSDDEKQEWADIQSIWDWVKSVRAASNNAVVSVQTAANVKQLYDAEKSFT